MTVVRAKGKYGPIDIEFQPHSEGSPDNFRGESIGKNTNVVFLTEYQRAGGAETGEPPFYSSVEIKRAFNTLDKKLGKEKAGNTAVIIVDVPLFESERKLIRFRNNLGTAAKYSGGAIAAHPAVGALENLTLHQKKNLENKRKRISGSRLFKRTPRLGNAVAKALNPDYPSRRKVLKHLGVGALLAGLGEIINNKWSSWIVRSPGHAGTVTEAARKSGAWLHGIVPSFIVEGRSAVIADRMESVLKQINEGKLNVGLRAGKKIQAAGLNSGGKHGGLIQMIEDPKARRKMLERFFPRIQRIHKNYQSSAWVFRRDSAGNVTGEKIKISPLFSSNEKRRLRQQSRRRIKREPTVRRNRRELLFHPFNRARKPFQRRI